MKLFSRLLLGFLAANVLTAIIVVVLGSRLWLMAYSDSDARSDARTAITLFEREGEQALQSWLREQRQRSGIYGMLLDDADGRLVHGRGRTPRVLRRHLEDDAPPDNGWMARTVGERVRSVTATGDDGREYRWVAIVPPPTETQSRWRDALFQILVGAFAITAAALLLARTLTRPIVKLRRLSTRIADGELSAEVPADLVQRRDELGDLARSLMHMTGRVRSLLDHQRQLLRDVSHELRSPLARLRLASELARNNANVQHFDRIDAETEKLDQLIGQILLLQRLDDPQAQEAESRFDFSALLRDVCDDIAYEADARGVRIEAPTTQPVMIADGRPTVLRAALENVLRNALRYSPDGESITVSAAGNTNAAITVTICDRGPGVPANRLQDIFEPFVRVSSARETGSGGHGVGLAIARRAVDLHGGNIRATNRDGGGLCVELQLPLRAPLQKTSASPTVN